MDEKIFKISSIHISLCFPKKYNNIAFILLYVAYMLIVHCIIEHIQYLLS